MPRIARAVASGFPHHVVQRGNNRDQVFFDREDRRRYLVSPEEVRGEMEFAGVGLLSHGQPCAPFDQTRLRDLFVQDDAGIDPVLHPAHQPQVWANGEALGESLSFLYR